MGKIINYLEQPEGWEPGFYNLESYEQYASIKALRSSELKQMRRSPAHYRAAIEFRKPPSATLQKSFDKGKAFDLLIIDGFDAFDAAVITEPDLNKNTKAYKEWKAEQPAGAVFLTQDEKNNILKMRDAAKLKKRFSEVFFSEGFPHRVIVWQDFRTQIWCKAEIDWICPDGTVVDLKTTADAGFWFFSRNAWKLGYANQGAFYLDGLRQVTEVDHAEFKLAAVEVDPPFESHVFNVPYDMLLSAQAKNEDYMEKLAWCFTRDEWPGYTDELMDLESGHYIYDDDLDALLEDYDAKF